MWFYSYCPNDCAYGLRSNNNSMGNEHLCTDIILNQTKKCYHIDLIILKQLLSVTKFVQEDIKKKLQQYHWVLMARTWTSSCSE